MYKISNFVEQEDALLGVLTVRESVTYALRLQSVPLLTGTHYITTLCPIKPSLAPS